MMPIARFEMPDGRIARFEVQEGTTPEQAQAMIDEAIRDQSFATKPQGFGADIKAAQQAQSNAQMTNQPFTPADFSGYKNFGMGAVKGASDIGKTLMYPIDAAGLTGMEPGQTKQLLDQFFAEYANPDSAAFQGGAIASQVAGTAGIGQLLARGAQAVGAAPKIINAMRSGGFSLGTPKAATMAGKLADAGTRIGAGAAVGGMSAGMIDPDSYQTGAMLGGMMPHGVQLAGMTGRGTRSLGAHLLGSTTGTGDASIRAAYQAGKSGDRAFVDHMRGNAEFDDVVNAAKQGLEKMRADRSNAYRNGMVNIKNDRTVLDMQPVLNEVRNIQQMGYFKGQPIQKNASSVVDDITNTVNEWAGLNPAEYHTPEGLDALKKAIGDIRDSTQFGTPARKAADGAYNAVKKQIEAQAPTYAMVMKDYANASDMLNEITRTLSLGDKPARDTAVRKLQSLMRNNAQTNYGNRLNLAKDMEQKGNVSLMPSLAGQTMNTWTPRGMTGAITKAAFPFAAGGAVVPSIMPAAGTAGAASATLPALGLMAASSPLFSPRMMGEALYGAGSLSRNANALLRPVGSFLGRVGGGMLGPAQIDGNALLRTLPLAISASQTAQQ